MLKKDREDKAKKEKDWSNHSNMKHTISKNTFVFDFLFVCFGCLLLVMGSSPKCDLLIMIPPCRNATPL